MKLLDKFYFSFFLSIISIYFFSNIRKVKYNDLKDVDHIDEVL
jgi:hypothetical protein